MVEYRGLERGRGIDLVPVVKNGYESYKSKCKFSIKGGSFGYHSVMISRTK
jgi:hypothetical protein